MNKADKYTSWPLPETLTRKVVNYLDVYRLIITVFLGIAHFGTLNSTPEFGTRPFFASVVLGVYLLFAVFYLFRGKEFGVDVYALARFSLTTDVMFLGLLVIFTSGIEALRLVIGIHRLPRDGYHLVYRLVVS